ncbi:MAG: phosphotransferase [Pseudomonadota bacterium]
MIPPGLLSREAEVFPATLVSALRHAELPESVIHSDVHLRNWYVTRDGRMGPNDWQCVCRGHWSRDLAYCLSTALRIDDRHTWERELIAYYLDRLQAAGEPHIEFDFAWRHYRELLAAASIRVILVVRRGFRRRVLFGGSVCQSWRSVSRRSAIWVMRWSQSVVAH